MNIVLMKDRNGHIIGFEKLNVNLAPGIPGLTVEVVTLPPNVTGWQMSTTIGSSDGESSLSAND